MNTRIKAAVRFEKWADFAVWGALVGLRNAGFESRDAAVKWAAANVCSEDDYLVQCAGDGAEWGVAAFVSEGWYTWAASPVGGDGVEVEVTVPARAWSAPELGTIVSAAVNGRPTTKDVSEYLAAAKRLANAEHACELAKIELVKAR